MINLTWRKGRPCDSGVCVEVAAAEGEVLVRSTLSPAMPLTLTRDEWRDFLAGAKEGLFDNL
jgi:hypothetical protein